MASPFFLPPSHPNRTFGLYITISVGDAIRKSAYNNDTRGAALGRYARNAIGLYRATVSHQHLAGPRNLCARAPSSGAGTAVRVAAAGLVALALGRVSGLRELPLVLILVLVARAVEHDAGVVVLALAVAAPCDALPGRWLVDATCGSM